MLSDGINSNIKLCLSIFVLVLFVIACKDGKFEKAQILYGQGKKVELAGHPDSAVVVYRQTLEILEGVRNDTLSGVICNRIGSLMFDNSLYLEACELYRQALSFNLKKRDKTEVSKSLRGIGKVKLFKGVSDSAIVCFKEALSLVSQICDKEEISLIHNNLSAAYFNMEAYPQSLLHNTKALRLSKDSVNIYKNLFSRGDLYTQLQQYDSALFYYELSSKSSAIYTKAGSYYRMAELAKIIGSKDSVRYLNNYQILKDSIDRSNKTSDILKGDNGYLLYRVKQNEKSKFAYYILAIFIISVAITFILVWQRRCEKSKFDKTLNELYQEMSKLKMELSDAIEKKQVCQEQILNEKIIKIQANTVKMIIRSGDKFAKKFQESAAYKDLRKRLDAENCILIEKDEKMYRNKVTDAFNPFIFYLETFFDLTSDECYYSCLSMLKFKTRECAICRNVSEEAIRTQKRRVKIKMCNTIETENLFNHIFQKTK